MWAKAGQGCWDEPGHGLACFRARRFPLQAGDPLLDWPNSHESLKHFSKCMLLELSACPALGVFPAW